MFTLTAIIFFLLGAWLGGHSAKDQIARLRARQAELEAELASSRKAKVHVGSGDAPEQVAPTRAGVVVAAASVERYQAFAKPVKPVDNAIVLLYFGAFLFTAAIGLFLAFGGLDGMTRSFLVALLVIAFYISGLFIFESSRRLKPAGLTFIGIGMVLLPFFGLALHILAFDRLYGAVTWLAISVIALVMYGYAYKVTRHVYVSYFMIGSLLSLFESSVAIIELPTYYFAWAMALCGIVLLALIKLQNRMVDLDEPLQLSSSIFVPASLLFSLFFIPDHGWGQVSMALFLGAAYYAVAAWIEAKPNLRAQLFGIADGLAIACLGTAAYAVSDTPRFVSLVLLFAAGAHVYVVWWLSVQQKVNVLLLETMTALTSAFALFGVVFVLLNATLLATAMVVCLAVHLALYLIRKLDWAVAVAGVIWLILPTIVGSYVLDPGLSASHYAIVYAETAGALFLFRWLMHHEKQSLNVLRLLYAAGLAASFAWALVAGAGPGAIAAIVLAPVAFALSYFENKPELSVPAIMLLYIAVALGCVLIGNDVPELITIDFAALSLMLYFGGTLVEDPRRSQFIRYTAIVGAYAAALAAPWSGIETILSPLALLIAGGLSLFDSFHIKNQGGKELSGAVLMAAFQWLLWLQGIENLQVYTHLWAALFAGYAIWRNSLKQPKDEESYTITALAVLTVPLALQSLGDAGEFYGWLLIAEQIGLVLIGMLVARPRIIQWGLTVSVLAVLYQLRELTFIVLALVGLGLIGLAVYLLTRRSE